MSNLTSEQIASLWRRFLCWFDNSTLVAVLAGMGYGLGAAYALGLVR